MNNIRSNLINSISYDRVSEFRLLIEQSPEPINEMKMTYDQKNLIHYLTDYNKLELLKILISIFHRMHQDKSQETRNLIIKEWVNQEDDKGLTPIFIAVYRAELVG